MPEPDTPAAIGWAILELMGHRRLAGYVTEQEIAGQGMLRLDVFTGPVPADTIDQPEATQFYSPSAVYCITPTTEQIARSVAAGRRPEPVARWELPAPERERDEAIEDAEPIGRDF